MCRYIRNVPYNLNFDPYLRCNNTNRNAKFIVSTYKEIEFSRLILFRQLRIVAYASISRKACSS